MLAPKAATLTTKLGKTRAGERSRIWIEGKRLLAAGWTRGMKFAKHFDADTNTLDLCVISDFEFDQYPHHLRGTVSGKGDHPIIDIVGTQVMETFSASTHVTVTYGALTITIEAAQ